MIQKKAAKYHLSTFLGKYKSSESGRSRVSLWNGPGEVWSVFSSPGGVVVETDTGAVVRAWRASLRLLVRDSVVLG